MRSAGGGGGRVIFVWEREEEEEEDRLDGPDDVEAEESIVVVGVKRSEEWVVA
jgi:hypothetical protein